MIWATGGALVPEKTFWYAIDFLWTNREWECASNEDVQATLEMKSSSETVHNVKCLEPESARQTLGV